jgi:hypothetical protein
LIGRIDFGQFWVVVSRHAAHYQHARQLDLHHFSLAAVVENGMEFREANLRCPLSAVRSGLLSRCSPLGRNAIICRHAEQRSLTLRCRAKLRLFQAELLKPQHLLPIILHVGYQIREALEGVIRQL